jgi:hypothetical protein
MKLVGEAMKDEPYKDNLTLIGISQWGKVALRNKLIVIIFVTLSDTYYYFAFLNFPFFSFRKRKK